MSDESQDIDEVDIEQGTFVVYKDEAGEYTAGLVKHVRKDRGYLELYGQRFPILFEDVLAVGVEKDGVKWNWGGNDE